MRNPTLQACQLSGPQISIGPNEDTHMYAEAVPSFFRGVGLWDFCYLGGAFLLLATAGNASDYPHLKKCSVLRHEIRMK